MGYLYTCFLTGVVVVVVLDLLFVFEDEVADDTDRLLLLLLLVCDLLVAVTDGVIELVDLLEEVLLGDETGVVSSGIDLSSFFLADPLSPFLVEALNLLLIEVRVDQDLSAEGGVIIIFL